jgi:DNA-binding response OmpR family regulator
VQKKLLIVDDEEEIRDYLRDFFADRDYSVVTASTKEGAMKALEDEKPLAALLDIRMRTSRDGIDLLQWIKDRKLPVKTIMVTAVEDEKVIQEVRKLGADDYITKPLSLEYLENSLSERIDELIKDLSKKQDSSH